MRHGQGYHNVAGEFDDSQYLWEDLEDAHLTPEGERQCEDLRMKTEKFLSNTELVITSPLNRAIQTALHSFPFLLNNVPWIALDQVREQTGQHPCDRRRPISEKQGLYPMVDFQYVRDDHDELYRKYTNCREPLESVIDRCRQFLSWLPHRSESEIIVVAHGIFIETLVHDVLKLPHGSLGKEEYETKEKLVDDNDLDRSILYERRYFNNCEMRTVKLELKENFVYHSSYQKYFD